VLGRFPPECFSVRAREKVNKIWLRLKSLQKAMAEGTALPTKKIKKSREPTSCGGTPEWRAFVSQRNISAKSLKDFFAKMRQTSGPASTAAILVEWAMDAPRGGNIGTNTELFFVLVETLITLTATRTLAIDTQQKLLWMIQRWEKEQGQWLQRLVAQNRKLGLADKLKQLRKAVDAPLQHVLDSVERNLAAALEGLGGAEILDGAGRHSHETTLLDLDAQLREFTVGASPSLVPPRLNNLRERLDMVISKMDQEIHRRNGLFAQLLTAVERAANRSEFMALRADVMRLLPSGLRTRPELEQAFNKANDRLILDEVEALERREDRQGTTSG